MSPAPGGAAGKGRALHEALGRLLTEELPALKDSLGFAQAPAGEQLRAEKELTAFLAWVFYRSARSGPHAGAGFESAGAFLESASGEVGRYGLGPEVTSLLSAYERAAGGPHPSGAAYQAAVALYDRLWPGQGVEVARLERLEALEKAAQARAALV